MNNEGREQVYIERDLPGKWAGRDSSATYQLSLVIHASFSHFFPFRKAAANMSCDPDSIEVLIHLLIHFYLSCSFLTLFHAPCRIDQHAKETETSRGNEREGEVLGFTGNNVPNDR